jgi:DNA polymerase/3'-5' exonuclease PolX
MDKARLPLREAAKLALEVIALLGDVCERVAIGGSIRRGKPLVGDIEIVCSPVSELALYRRCDDLLRMEVFTKRLNIKGTPIAWGPRYRAGVYRGVPLDLFIVLPDRQWGPTMVLRTGPNFANQALVTQIGRRSSDGVAGVLLPGMKFDEGAVWLNGQKLDTPEEWDVFYALRLPFIAPHMRSEETYRICREREQWHGIELPSKAHHWLAMYPPVRDGVYWPGEGGAVDVLELTVPNLAAARIESMKQGALFDVPGKRTEYG